METNQNQVSFTNISSQEQNFWILTDLRKSGLSDEIIEEMAIEPIEHSSKGGERINELLGFHQIEKLSIIIHSECYAIHYPNCNLTRVKLQTPIKISKDGKEEIIKYLSPLSNHVINGEMVSPFHLYCLPKDKEKLGKTKYAIAITEGEKKTAKLAQELRKIEGEFKTVAVGVPGVTMWNNASEWKTEIKKVAGRNIILFFDSDFQENPEVATQLLSLYLTLRKLKANPLIATWPLEQGKGIDDYLVNQGSESETTIKSLLKNAKQNPFDAINVNDYQLADILAKYKYSQNEVKALLAKFPKFPEKAILELVSDKKGKKRKESAKKNLEKIKQLPKGIFWYEDVNGELKISVSVLLQFLAENGFSFTLLDKDNDCQRTLIQKQGRIVQEVDIPFVRYFVADHVNRQPDMVTENFSRSQLIEKLSTSIGQYINETTVNMIPYQKINFLEDSSDCAYFPFTNGIVKLTKDECQIFDYKQIEGDIWKSSIIPYNFSKVDNSSIENFEFYQFLQNICSFRNESRKELDKQRFISLMCSIGYLLHRYKTSAISRSIVLCEASLDENPQGRTGKGLIMQAIGKLRKVRIIDGKNFQIDSPFVFQNVNLDTQILFLDDVSKNFNFQRLYSVITEGLSFEKKRQDRVILPPEKSPKVAISTNFGILGNSESDKGRRFEMELLCYYSSSFRPFDEFGHEFFHTWNESEWNIFFNVMLSCCGLYLRFGTPTYPTATISQKRLLTSTDPDFVKFVSEIELEQYHPTETTYRKFLQDFGVSEKDVAQPKFRTWLKQYADAYELKFDIKVNWSSEDAKSVRCFCLKKRV